MKLKLLKNSDGVLAVNRWKIFTFIVQMHSTVSQKMSQHFLKEETRVHGFQSSSNSNNEEVYFICLWHPTRINSLWSFSVLLWIIEVDLPDYLDLCVDKTMILSSSYALPQLQYTKCLEKISSFIKTPYSLESKKDRVLRGRGRHYEEYEVRCILLWLNMLAPN